MVRVVKWHAVQKVLCHLLIVLNRIFLRIMLDKPFPVKHFAKQLGILRNGIWLSDPEVRDPGFRRNCQMSEDSRWRQNPRHDT